MILVLVAFVWLFIAFWAVCIFRSAGRRTPVPPARPRVRLLQDREHAGRVEILPGFGDAENAHTRARGKR